MRLITGRIISRRLSKAIPSSGHPLSGLSAKSSASSLPACSEDIQIAGAFSTATRKAVHSHRECWLRPGCRHDRGHERGPCRKRPRRLAIARRSRSRAEELRERLRLFSVQRGLGRAYPPILPSNDGKIGGMAKRKTSVAFDDDTLAILARRADEAHLDRSAYLTELIKRDDLRRRIAIDSANLDAAGYTSDRASAITSAILTHRRAVR